MISIKRMLPVFVLSAYVLFGCVSGKKTTLNYSFVVGTIATQEVNGEKIRELKFYRNKNMIAERTYKNGDLFKSNGSIPDGVVLDLFDSGEVRGLGLYKNERRNGKALQFYKNGVLKGEAFYRNGDIHGFVTMYYENGNKMSEQEFIDGKEQYTLVFDEDGKLKRKMKEGIVQEEY